MDGSFKLSLVSPGLQRTAKRVVLGCVVVGLLTLFCFRLHLNFATASLVYLLAVVIQSLTADFASSVVAALIAFLCLDYFFVPPLFSFTVADPFNLLALIAFLTTALVITHFASKARREARSSEFHRRRLDTLYGLAQQLLAMEPETSLSKRSLEAFRAVSNARATCLYDAGTAELHLVGYSHSGLPDKAREAHVSGRDADDAVSAVSVRCLRAAGRTIGAIGFEGLANPESEIGPLAALAATLLERTRSFRSASHAAAAAQAEGYRSAILDALAHEFKNPLATILTAAGGLREAGPLLPQQQELADLVESEAARLGRLASKLLRLARLDQEEVKPRMESVDMMAVVERTVEQYSRQSTDRQVVLRYESGSAQVVADPELLRLAVSQLMENACKYSRPGSPVTLSVERQPQSVAVRVSNSGSSIPRHEQARIFERFRRGGATRQPGSGLGLYVARKIAVAHGGSLDLEISEPIGDGATFRLTIPTSRGELDRIATRT